MPPGALDSCRGVGRLLARALVCRDLPCMICISGRRASRRRHVARPLCIPFFWGRCCSSRCSSGSTCGRRGLRRLPDLRRSSSSALSGPHPTPPASVLITRTDGGRELGRRCRNLAAVVAGLRPRVTRGSARLMLVLRRAGNVLSHRFDDRSSNAADVNHRSRLVEVLRGSGPPKNERVVGV